MTYKYSLTSVKHILRLSCMQERRIVARNFRRWQSTQHQLPDQRHFWTTSRVLLFTAFTGSLNYLYGLNETSSFLRKSLARPAVSSPPVYATKSDMEKAISEFESQLGEDGITTDDDELHRHGYSEWSSINIDVLPVAVAYPKSTEEVQRIAKVCSKYKIPMVPYSGGSSLEANFSASHGGISIDFVHMDQVLALRPDDLDVTVQPGLGWMKLNDDIKDSGLFFPVDPGPSAMIGGMVGTGCSGTNAFRYGTMREWVINLTVVLADGTVVKTRRRPRKSAAGYNLTSLFVGSEGTLGIVTEITLKLTPLPQQTSVGVVGFPSIRHAASCAQSIIRSGVPVAAMELMDEVQMGVVNKAGFTARKWKEVPTLFFKFSGTPNAVNEHIGQVKSISSKSEGSDFEFTTNEQEQHALWSARKESLWSMLAMKRDGDDVWSTDVAVPISRLADIISDCKKEMDELGLFASTLGHVGDGNFHESILYRRSDPEERKKVEEHVYRMVERGLEMEGTCTGEHGVGVGKKQSLVKELGLDAVGVMKKVKASLDPDGLMNPGKVFDL